VGIPAVTARAVFVCPAGCPTGRGVSYLGNVNRSLGTVQIGNRLLSIKQDVNTRRILAFVFSEGFGACRIQGVRMNQMLNNTFMYLYMYQYLQSPTFTSLRVASRVASHRCASLCLGVAGRRCRRVPMLLNRVVPRREASDHTAYSRREVSTSRVGPRRPLDVE
jgi:hypothetical protein